jgi:DNA primase
MKAWFEAALGACDIYDDAVDELMGRGATRDLIKQWNIKSFEPPIEPCPDESLHERFGPHFEVMEGRTIFPLYSPRGQLLGFDSRAIGRKNEVRLMLPESHWQPVWINMPGAMDKIFQRRIVVVVEGRYDVFAMLQIVKKEVVLGSGPAHLNWRQLEFLRRWNVEVWVVFDQDPTGRKGTEQALKDLRARGVECREIPYGRSGDDPGGIWDRGGVPALQGEFPYF